MAFGKILVCTAYCSIFLCKTGNNCNNFKEKKLMWRDTDICLHGKNKSWLLENLLHKPFIHLPVLPNLFDICSSIYRNTGNPTFFGIMVMTTGSWLTFSCNWTKIETTTTDSFEQELSPMPIELHKSAIICCSYILTNMAKHWHLVDIKFSLIFQLSLTRLPCNEEKKNLKHILSEGLGYLYPLTLFSYFISYYYILGNKPFHVRECFC